MNQFSLLENKIKKILNQKHDGVEIESMWPNDEKMIISLEYKKGRKSIVVSLNDLDELENKINSVASELKQRYKSKPSKNLKN